MRTPAEVIAGVKACGVVAVIRADNAEEALGAVKAVRDGGVLAIEVTFTVPNAEKIIAKLAGELSDDVYLGAGTVTTVEQAKMAIEAGAQYMVSPAYDAEVFAYAKRQNVAFFPGVLTPTEVLAAKKAGAEVFKIFPASRMGPAV